MLLSRNGSSRIGSISRHAAASTATAPVVASAVLCKTRQACTSKHNSFATTLSQCAHTANSNNASPKQPCLANIVQARKDALYSETAIRRDFGYPIEYHAGSFPWLLSAERQRIPVNDLAAHAGADGNARLRGFVQWLPIAARRRLAHSLNTYIARQALGPQAMDEVCAGAAMVLPGVARLLSSISSGEPDGPDTAASLAAMFSPPLLARFSADLARLRRDNVQLALEVRHINSARIHQIRTQTGPAEAFASLASLHTPSSGLASSSGVVANSLRSGLVRQAHRFSNMLGVTHAVPAASTAGPSDRRGPLEALSSWAGGVWAASQGCADVGVRVDVELNVDMRYRLIGCHSGPSEYDRHNGTRQVI
ncbi:hypothetical protein GGI15_003582, partial [Coemansia interrupta]